MAPPINGEEFIEVRCSYRIHSMHVKLRGCVIGICLFLAGSLSTAVIYSQTAGLSSGFKIHQLGFEALGSPASIPKTWKLVSAVPGTAVNATNLWFQDDSGNLFSVHVVYEEPSGLPTVWHDIWGLAAK